MTGGQHTGKQHTGGQLAGWHPTGGASATIVDGESGSAIHDVSGDRSVSHAWASVSKLVTALTCLVAVEERTISIDDEVRSFPGITVAHLLSHAAGLAFDKPVRMAPPLTKRLYSNASIRLAAAHVERRSGIEFGEYVRTAVLEPLHMVGVRWGDPAAGAHGTIDDLAALAQELLRPTIIDGSTLEMATAPWFGDLDGVVPGFGMQRPCPWGLGFEIKGHKQPHWTGTTNSSRTFGHFGQSGAMLAVDPAIGVAWCSLSPIPFGPWAKDEWPRWIDDCIAHGPIATGAVPTGPTRAWSEGTEHDT